MQGIDGGVKMTGRKRQKVEVIPSCSSHVLGMRFDFVGDFGTPHLLADIEGSRDKRNFIARYRRGERPVPPGVLQPIFFDIAKYIPEKEKELSLSVDREVSTSRATNPR